MFLGKADVMAKRVSLAVLVFFAAALVGIAWLANDWSAPLWGVVLFAGAIVLWVSAAFVVLAPLGAVKALSAVRARFRSTTKAS
ncbi:MAG: hypothetical protein K1Y02_22360 [Candidatus Hydrogenedentes bacterium]|nr:hypothetical protein [Candidatus Hydrogenedentota bacterium]